MAIHFSISSNCFFAIRQHIGEKFSIEGHDKFCISDTGIFSNSYIVEVNNCRQVFITICQ